MDGQNFNNEQNEMYENYSVEQPVEVVAENQSNTLAVVSLVMGILSIILCCCYGIGIVFGIAGIICGAIAKKKGQSKGLSTAGLVCSIIGSVFSVIAIIYYAWAIAMVASDATLMDQILSSYY